MSASFQCPECKKTLTIIVHKATSVKNNEFIAELAERKAQTDRLREKLVYWANAAQALLETASFTKGESSEAISYLLDFPECADAAKTPIEFARAAGLWWINCREGEKEEKTRWWINCMEGQKDAKMRGSPNINKLSETIRARWDGMVDVGLMEKR